MFIKGKLDDRLHKIILEADTLRSKTRADLSKANDAYNHAEIADIGALQLLKKHWLFNQNEQMRKLNIKFFGEVDKIKEELMQNTFAPGPALLADFRSVYDSLSEVKEADLIRRKYENAVRFKDAPAMKAIAARAADLGINSVLQEHKKRDGSFAKNADDYIEFSDGANDRTALMGAKLNFTAITEPPLKRKDVNFGFTYDREGTQQPYFRPAYYYEGEDEPGDMKPSA